MTGVKYRYFDILLGTTIDKITKIKNKPKDLKHRKHTEAIFYPYYKNLLSKNVNKIKV